MEGTVADAKCAAFQIHEKFSEAKLPLVLAEAIKRGKEVVFTD